MLARVGIVGVGLVLCLLLLPSPASAQAIGGTVTDETGGVLPGVTIEVRSPALIEQVRTADLGWVRPVPDHGAGLG